MLAAAALLALRGQDSAGDRPIGLFSSLPIVWREAADVSDLLRGDVPPHWALAVLNRRGAVRPLDTLAGKGGELGLPARSLLVMAQPRPLSAQENVALDAWVRDGGRVLLFADPMLTAHSAFALGDKRRPQDIALLSPILTRWGLILQFDEDQAAGERSVAAFGLPLPVNLPGRLAKTASSACRIEVEGIVARCPIGRGAALVVADAALLEDGTDGDAAARGAMLERLLAATAD